MKKGFTLIEVLGAIVILSIAIVPVMGLIQSTLVISQKQEWETKCLYYAQQKMEEMIAVYRNNFMELTRAWGTVEGNYKYRIQTSADGGVSLKDLKIIAMTVWYDENQTGTSPDPGETKVTLTTKMARRGPLISLIPLPLPLP